MNYSYSRLSTFDRCPMKFKYKYLDEFEIPDNDNVVFEKGRYLHLLLEHYPEVPEFEFKFEFNESKKSDYIHLINNLCLHEKKIKFLLSNCISKEQQFYLNAQLYNCVKEDQLVNGVIDYVGRTDNSIILVDWKSGLTKKYASFDQLKLYSLWAFNEYQDINTVVAFLYFVEQNICSRLNISKTESFIIKAELIKKIDIIEQTSEFNKIKKEDCQFCPYFKHCNPYKVKI